MIRFFVLVPAIALACASALAQTLPERLAECQRIADDEAKLACFEALALNENDGAQDEATDESVARNEPPTLPQSTETESLAATIPAATAPPSAAVSVRSTEPRATTAAPIEAPPYRNFESSVQRAWEDPYGKILVELDNGEVWKQTTRGSRRVPNSGSVVSARRSLFGAWFFKFGDSNRETRMALLK
ncbi:MAG: hypothetical protein AAF829_11705 [Pseudomonadota bacterium]